MHRNPRLTPVAFIALFSVLVPGLREGVRAQDAATRTFLNGLSGTRQEVARIVVDVVQETGGRVIAVGSWVSGGKYADPLAGGVSDHDMRLVMPANSSEQAAVGMWRDVRAKITDRVKARFGGQADDVLRSINLYPPDELLAGADDAAEALARMRSLGVNPNLGGAVTEGLWGKGAKAFRDAYEASSGRVFWAESGTVRSGLGDLLPLGETRGIYTIGGSANTASQFTDKALDALEQGDGKTLRKQLERLNEVLQKGRSLGRLEPKNYFDDILELLRKHGDDVAALNGELATNPQMVAKLRAALSRSKLDAELLKRYAESVRPRDLQILREMLEEGTGRWARIKGALGEAASHVPWGTLVQGLMAFFVYLETVDIAQTAGAGDHDAAFNRILGNLGFAASLPAGLLASLVNAILEDARESGIIFVTKFQDCEDLVAGIYSVKGREDVSDAQKIERSVDELARQYVTPEQIRAVVALHARNAATRELGDATRRVDTAVEEALNRRCAPRVIEKWQRRRAEMIGDAAVLLLAVDRQFGAATVALEVAPAPVILSGSPARGDAAVGASLNADSSALSQAMVKFESTLEPLGGPRRLVSVSFRATYTWTVDGREVASDERLLTAGDRAFDPGLASRIIPVSSAGSHAVAFRYALAFRVAALADDVLAAKPYLERTIESRAAVTVEALDGDWRASITGPDQVNVRQAIALSADLSPSIRRLPGVSLQWTNDTARMGLPPGESVTFTPEARGVQRFTLDVFATVGGRELRVAGATKTVAVEGDEAPPSKPPGAVRFSATIPDNWEGGNTPQGFALKRKGASIKGPCGGDATVTAAIDARFTAAAEPKDAAGAMALAESRFKDRRQGSTPNDPAVGLFMAGGVEGASAFSMGDYQGAIADFALWMRRGSAGMFGATSSYFGANGRGDVVKAGGGVRFTYSVSGGGCWDNSDRAYLITHGVAAQEEARAILASLRVDDAGVIATRPYDGPKYDGTDLPRVALQPAVLPKLKVGDRLTVEAVVENAKPEDAPLVYNWTGQFEGTADAVRQQRAVPIVPAKPGKYTLSVRVDGSRFSLGSASLEYEVSEYKVVVARASAPPARLPVGVATGLTATLTVDGKPAAGEFVYRWEPSTEVRFATTESASAATSATFVRPGRTPVWVVVLVREGGALTTVAESAHLEIEVVSPEMAIVFNPERGAVGTSVRATVTTSVPELAAVDIRWEVSANARLLGDARDARQITFVPLDAGPVTVTARARAPVTGLDLGAATATYTAAAPGTGGVPAPAGPPGTGAAGEAQARVARARELVRKGELDEAITLVDEAARLNPGSTEAASLGTQWKTERDRCLDQIRRTRQLIAEGRFVDAQRELVVAQNLHGSWKPVADMARELGDEWSRWDRAIQDDLYRIRDASERREFRRALDLVAKRRQEGRLGPYAGDLAQAEAWARRWETEKEQQRRILKGAEEKFNRHDYAGALKDFELGFANFGNLWAESDPEPAYYDKIRTEAIARDNRINELMPHIRRTAEDANARTDLIETVIRNADEVLRLQPENADARRYRTILEARLKARGSGTASAALVREGRDHFDNGRYTQAIASFDRAIAASPDLAEAYVGRGLARRAAQDYAGAMADFNRAIQLEPNGPEGYRGRSMTRRSQGDFRGAVEDADRAVALDPGSDRAYLTRGLAREGMGDFDGALADYTRAIEINPSYANSYAYRGLVRLTQKNDPRGALADFDRQLQLAPDDAVAFNNRGVARERLGDTAGALADYRRALEIRPDYETARRNRDRLMAVPPPAGAPAFHPVDLTPAGGVRGTPQTVKGIPVDAGSRLRLKSTGNHRTVVEIPLSPPVQASSVAIVTNLDDATYLEQGRTIARMVVLTSTGEERFEIQAGVHSSEWNYRAVNPPHRWVDEASLGDGRFLVTFPLGRPGLVRAIRFEYVETGAKPWMLNAPGFTLSGVTLVGGGAAGPGAAPAAAAPARPAGTTDAELFSNSNAGGVGNGPTAPTVFTLTGPHVITSILTYHWNSARGSVPGTVALRDASGRTWGPWPTIGSPGQGGVPNAYWTCTPNVLLPAGTYTIVDSDPGTWSQNPGTGGRGIVSFPVKRTVPKETDRPL